MTLRKQLSYFVCGIAVATILLLPLRCSNSVKITPNTVTKTKTDTVVKVVTAKADTIIKVATRVKVQKDTIMKIIEKSDSNSVCLDTITKRGDTLRVCAVQNPLSVLMIAKYKADTSKTIIITDTVYSSETRIEKQRLGFGIGVGVQYNPFKKKFDYGINTGVSFIIY